MILQQQTKQSRYCSFAFCFSAFCFLLSAFCFRDNQRTKEKKEQKDQNKTRLVS